MQRRINESYLQGLVDSLNQEVNGRTNKSDDDGFIPGMLVLVHNTYYGYSLDMLLTKGGSTSNIDRGCSNREMLKVLQYLTPETIIRKQVHFDIREA